MDMLTEKTKKLYLKFLIPSLGSAMVMSIYTITDAIVIGQGVGADALAALSITTPLLCILMATGITFGVGGSVHMNINTGKGDAREAGGYFTLSLIMISFFTVLLWIIYAVFMKQIVVLMGANEVLFPYVMDYMKYILIFFPVVVFSNYCAIFSRADNDPNRAMIAVISGGIVNIVLNIFLVMFRGFGIGGAALASVIGMTLQVLISSSHFLSSSNNIRISKPVNVVCKAGHIFSAGFSGFLNELSNGTIVFLFNIQVLRYSGNTALAVYSVISNCVILFNSLYTGVCQAVLPVISINFGAGKYDRIKELAKMAFCTIIAMGAIFSITGLVFPHVVCSVFTHESAKMAEIAGYGIRLYFIAFLPMSINILTSYYMQGVLLTRESVIISVMRNILLSGILILVLPVFLGANVLWCIMPMVEIAALIMSFIFLKKASRKLRN